MNTPSFLKNVLLCVVGLSIIACGGGDDTSVAPPVTPPDTPITTPKDDVLSEAAKQFVGYWRNSVSSRNDYDFVFYPSGKCSRYSSDQENFCDEGYWSLNEEINYLATTLGGWQWQITLSKPDSWAGVSLGSSGRAQSYSRDDLRYVKASLSNCTWKCNDLTMKIGTTFSSDDYTPLEETCKPVAPQNKIIWMKRYIDLSNPEISEKVLKADYVIKDIYKEDKYTIWGVYYDSWNPTTELDKGVITINNPGDDNATVVLSTKPDHVFKKQTN